MYQKILYATDFDEVGYNAAKKAKQVAEKFSGTLYLVHVIEPFPAYAYPGFAGFTEVEAPLKEHAEREMEKLAEQLNVPRSQRYLEIGSTKSEILSVASELDVDLIVAGSHDKHGLAFLLGSTSNAISHGANCDVLIVRDRRVSTIS
ncbi:MAG: universal stress protein [Gammaproteobacteria bacterium]